MDISDLRKQIDAVDDALIKLFIQRMDIAADIAKYKSEHGLPIHVPERELEVLRSVSERSGPELAGYGRVLYSMLFELSRSYQRKLLPAVAFGEQALRQISPDAHRIGITMVIQNEEDILFKVIAQQQIHGLKIIDLKMGPASDDRIVLTMETDRCVPSDRISDALNELAAMSLDLSVYEAASEVAP